MGCGGADVPTTDPPENIRLFEARFQVGMKKGKKSPPVASIEPIAITIKGTAT
jgi:hypothetical protein